MNYKTNIRRLVENHITSVSPYEDINQIFAHIQAATDGNHLFVSDVFGYYNFRRKSFATPLLVNAQEIRKDYALQLCAIRRWNIHTIVPSVGLHTMAMVNAAKAIDAGYILEILLHDAHEIVTSDIPAPIKFELDSKSLSRMERDIDIAIEDSLCLNTRSLRPQPMVLKCLDELSLDVEFASCVMRKTDTEIVSLLARSIEEGKAIKEMLSTYNRYTLNYVEGAGYSEEDNELLANDIVDELNKF